jgi:hypothetical protein
MDLDRKWYFRDPGPRGETKRCCGIDIFIYSIKPSVTVLRNTMSFECPFGIVLPMSRPHSRTSIRPMVPFAHPKRRRTLQEIQPPLGYLVSHPLLHHH